MTISEKLKIIQKMSGLTQEKLAKELGVSFVTLNRWINKRSAPRKKTVERIDVLYRKNTGEETIPKDILEAKKKILAKKSRKYKNILKKIMSQPDIRDQFVLSLTYNSNVIEGSTLTEPETAAILFQDIALPNKTLVEQLEAKNHQTALKYLFTQTVHSKKISEELILKLHGILMNGIRDDAGMYRRHAVRIVGANIPTANYLKVPRLMGDLIVEINKKKEDTLLHTTIAHSHFEKIHPFSDGNGRIGRLLIHAMLLRKNLPPAVIKQEKKRLYYLYLNKSQREDDFSLLEDFIGDAIFEGFSILERK